jgi:small subunit ribosomal protein S16
MKQMGRTHRHFYRIVAIDHRQPRDGKVIEELGTYDPFVKDKDQRVTLVPDRIQYWTSVGAQVSDRVQIFLNKYMAKFQAEAAANHAPPANPNIA